MKRVLLMQSREDAAPNSNEFEAVLKHGRIGSHKVSRVQMHAEDFHHLDMRDYAAVIVGGGPYDVSKPQHTKDRRQHYVEQTLKKHIQSIYAHDIPYFGVCYGLGVLVDALGGVVTADYGEAVGPVALRVTEHGLQDPLMSALDRAEALVGHHEGVHALPEGALLLASSSTCPVQAIRVKQNMYGFQFHPELDAEGLAIRLDAYRHHGYFEPEEYDAIMGMARQADLRRAHQLLEAFCQRYVAD